MRVLYTYAAIAVMAVILIVGGSVVSCTRSGGEGEYDEHEHMGGMHEEGEHMMDHETDTMGEHMTGEDEHMHETAPGAEHHE